VLFFAGGLDPTQSHTIQLINYDDQYPNAPSTSPCGVSSAAVDSLVLIMDDTASRDAMLAAFNSTLSASSTPSPSLSPTPSPTFASSTSTTAIVAGVLGGFLLILVILVIFFVIAWMRLRKEVGSPHHIPREKGRRGRGSLPDPTPWTFEMSTAAPTSQSSAVPSNYVGAPSLPSIQSGSVGREATAQTPEVTAASPASGVRNGQRYKRPVRVQPRQDTTELHPSSPNIARQNGDDTLSQAGTFSSAPFVSAPRQRSHPSGPKSQGLGDLVNTLSAVLNGHLHEEFLHREGIEGLPEYPDEE